MRRIAMYLFGFAATFFLTLSSAQQPDPNQTYRGPSQHVPGIYLPPVAGAPFSAKEEVRNEQTLADGTVLVKHTTTVVARDLRGRIHDEIRRLVTPDFRGMPTLLQVHIFDPQTRLSSYYAPDSYIVRQHTFIEPAKKETPPNPNEKTEDLGSTTISGIFVHGTRHTTTYPGRATPVGRSVSIVEEFWYSEDLQLNIQIKRSDPRTGTQTVTLTDLVPAEPDAALFEIPDGYKVLNFDPPNEAPKAHGPMDIGGGVNP